ncbi:MAG: hypothetical protein IT423_04675, partial [Pirellulaceae bacterium]|nr:hypothetical protein [Pirellulaceae bacterium]
MENESVSKESSDSLRPIWSYKLLIGSVVLVGLTYAVRLIAQEWDNSVANVLTLILGFCTWLTATWGLARSQISRIWWRMLAAAPFVIIGVTLARYRVTGIDGELVPHFAPRWVAKAQPPTEASKADGSQPSSGIAAEQLQLSARDFPQFLGPNRNGVVPETQLETDWASHPPEVLWKQPIGTGWSGFAVQGNVAVTLEQ